MQPFDIKLSYLGAPWCTVVFELGHDELGDADDPEFKRPDEAAEILRALGFPEPAPVPLMPLCHQVAQKLHGVSEPGSKRAHDLIDLQLIGAHECLDLAEVRTTCERLFAYRRARPWPPTVIAGEGWESLYAEQVGGLDVLPTVLEAVAWVNELIGRIARA